MYANYKKFNRIAPCCKCHNPFWGRGNSSNLEYCTQISQGSEAHYDSCMCQHPMPMSAKKQKIPQDICTWFPASFTYDNRF